MSENNILEKFYALNNMNSFTLNEKINLVNAQKLLNSNIIDEEYKGSLKKYLKHYKNGKVVVEYTQNEIGRLGIKVKELKEDETCITQPYMWKECKSALCKSLYLDVDMVNAHPTFLEQTFNANKFECPVLQSYNSNRDAWVESVGKKCALNRDQVKKLIMIICYNGSVEKFCNENNIKKVSKKILHLEKEIKENSKKLLALNELLPYRMKALEIKGEKHYNLDGTALSLYLQTIECKCLMSMFKYCKSNNYEVGALIHDGLHLRKFENVVENKKVICDEMSLEIKKKVGIDIKVKIKEFCDIPELDSMVVINTDKEGGSHISLALKDDYIISKERIFMRINDVWTENEKVIKRELMKRIGNMNIFMGDDYGIKPYSTMKKGANDMLAFVEPKEDNDFVDKLWTSNLYKLCFKNGVYDFKQGKLVKYDSDTNTTIKINRDLKEPSKEVIEQVYQRILNPIFNNDKKLMDCWLNFIARGLAGHIEDKNWGVGMGERDCGKGVLVGLLENCFGDYCRSTNSENFLFKKGQSDSAKAFSWLVPFEFRRLILTNEITIDAQGKYRINGNVLKKLSSGGDKIEARVNFKDEVNFKIQARPCMFCNDLPPIEPADAKETAYMFRYPSKFLNPDDDRLGKPIMRPITYEENGEVKYELDENGEKKMVNVCNFYLKDDSIKSWCQEEEVLNAFIYIIFQQYGEKAEIPDNMKEEMLDFKEDEKEEDIFLSLFRYPNDDNWDSEEKDWVSKEQIKHLQRKARISLSPQKYKNYLLGKGCSQGKRTDKNNKRINAWIGLQVDEDRVEQMISMIDDE